MSSTRIVRLVPLALSLAAGSVAAQDARQNAAQHAALSPAAIDSTVARLFALNMSPSFGIVVVRDTQVLYMKGFGYADVDQRRAFTPQTVFYVASTTKAFTGLAAAILDGQGRFKLDAPLKQYLPQAKLRPPLDPDSITIRSLLTHTHGIGGGPVELRLAYTGEYTGNDQLVALLAEHPALDSRAYRYSNLGYNIAALAMDRVTGESWKRTLDRLIFTPLGMRNTTATISGVAPDRLAMPYRVRPTAFERVPFGKVDANMQSAGGLVTTLEDEARWLEAQLNDGKLDGRQVIPAAAMRETHKQQVSFTQNVRGVKVTGYGFGWNVGTLNGDTILTHGGGFPGFATHISFLPQRHIGVVTFANNEELGSALAELAAQAVYGLARGEPAISPDSLAALSKFIDGARQSMKAELDRRAQRPQTLPLPIDAYTGRYESPVMGSLVFSRRPDGKLEARAGAATSAVEVYDGAKHQLRVELFGNGAVVTMEVEGDRVVAAAFNGVRYRKV
ncbi:MAG TPA: serine hydrolase domain-containing protein [Gemmatimonadaceae bacterium]|nr:serine hydrolase domain-containing protein [Gemmatimonadaceae bacterium]